VAVAPGRSKPLGQLLADWQLPATRAGVAELARRAGAFQRALQGRCGAPLPPAHAMARDDAAALLPVEPPAGGNTHAQQQQQQQGGDELSCPRAAVSRGQGGGQRSPVQLLLQRMLPAAGAAAAAAAAPGAAGSGNTASEPAQLAQPSADSATVLPTLSLAQSLTTLTLQPQTPPCAAGGSHAAAARRGPSGNSRRLR
jgi:hypothetical protein